MSRSDTQFIESFVDLISRQLFINQQAENHSDDFRFGFVDDELTRTIACARDIGIAVGSFFHPDLSLPSMIETSSPATFGNHCTLVFGKHAGHFPKHPISRRGAIVVAGKNNRTAGSLKLLDDNILIRELSSEAIRRKNQHGFDFALCHSVAEAIEGRSIQAGAAEAIILVQVLRADLIIILPSVFLNGGDLRGDVFVELLLGAGDSRVKGCNLHHFPPGLLGVAVKARGLSVCD